MATTIEELEARIDKAAEQFKGLSRIQNTLDEILASQKALRQKQEELERQFLVKKKDLFSKYTMLADLGMWFVNKFRKELEALELPQKEREENESANQKA